MTVSHLASESSHPLSKAKALLPYTSLKEQVMVLISMEEASEGGLVHIITAPRVSDYISLEC